MQRIGPGMVQQFQTRCDICKGQGEIIRGKVQEEDERGDILT